MTRSQYKEGLLLMGTINGLIAETEHDLVMTTGAEGVQVCAESPTGRVAALRAVRDYLFELLDQHESVQDGPKPLPLLKFPGMSPDPEEV